MRSIAHALLFPLLGGLSLGCQTESEGAGFPDAGVVQDADTEDADGDVDADAGAAELVIATQKGRVEGKLSAGIRAFLGIPFGAPPIGDKRWTAPEPPAAWEGVRTAQEYGPICSQNNPAGTVFDPKSSEDCLYLNVWTPPAAASAKLPVMVWIYGGAYVFGSGGPPYNGETLAKEGNVVVVTLNYRLGPLGYLAHPGITAEASGSGGAKANFGVLDQRLALAWVRDNIEAFGGDAGNVTLFGESAGANSVIAHLIAEGSWSFFHRAIVESGLVFKPALTLPEAEAQGSRLATSLGCTDPQTALACMRSLPANMVTRGAGSGYVAAGGLLYQESGRANLYMPVIDDAVLKEQPEAAFAAGHVARVPLLHGGTTDEGILFHVGIFGDRPPVDLQDYQTSLTNRFGASAAAAVMARYPAFATDLVSISTDAVFRCPTVRLATYLSNHDFVQYLYRFDLKVNTSLPTLVGKSFHSADIPYVFGNSYPLGSVPPENAALPPVIMGYWTRFAKTGDPNGDGAPSWPRYDNTNTPHLNIAQPISQGNDLGTGCDFWANIAISAP